MNAKTHMNEKKKQMNKQMTSHHKSMKTKQMNEKKSTMADE